jgi:hypothetical protein
MHCALVSPFPPPRCWTLAPSIGRTSNLTCPNRWFGGCRTRTTSRARSSTRRRCSPSCTPRASPRTSTTSSVSVLGAAEFYACFEV